MTASGTVTSAAVPALRIRHLNGAPIRPEGEYVLYWMIAARRPRSNYALDRAVELARRLGKPLVVLEALRVGYPWASDRIHRFVLDGMADNRRAFEGTGVLYHPYVEAAPGDGKGLLEALAGPACAVVTDDFPAFFLPRMVEAAATKLQALAPPVGLEAVDSNGILPMRATDRVFARAYDFRRFLQREVRPFLSLRPTRDPLAGGLPGAARLPESIASRWPAADDQLLGGGTEGLVRLPIDHQVGPVPYPGGAAEADRVLERFVAQRLGRYEERNQPEADATSGLSPYLHFGHVSSHDVLAAVAGREGWSPSSVSDSTSGRRSGWWRMSDAAEAFLDESITWRELGLNFCAHREDYDRWESLPEWARTTLTEHEADPRPYVYSQQQLEQAETHDALWNAAQNQLRSEGRIHNYLRMLWGKKILHWTESPRRALEVMIRLNDRYAVDGRDPNSYSGIFWVLGRYDRPWGPERPVFGKIRYMTSANTRRKLNVKGYVERWTQPSLDL